MVSNARSAAGVSSSRTGQYEYRLLPGVGVDREKLHCEQQGRVDANDGCRARFAHFQGVEAIARADVQYVATIKRGDGIIDARPFPVAAPLGIDLDFAER